MFYSLKNTVFFRRYGEIGYIYNSVSFVDEVVDLSASIFIGALSYEFKDIDHIVSEISEKFDNVDFDELKSDVVSYFGTLEEDGFLDVCEDVDCREKSVNKYNTLMKRMSKEYMKTEARMSSYEFLCKYFMKYPYLNALQIELTRKCNERCIHCYIPNEEKNTDINDSLMFNILEECKDMGVMTLMFSGGEPMLHPKFCDFITRAKDADMNVVILSNLTLLNDQIIDVLRYKHPSCVHVSLYSMYPEIHDYITTVKGSFEKTIDNILKLLDNNIPVQINCPVIQQNKDSFQDVISWGEQHKCTVNVDYIIMARSDRSTDNLGNRLTGHDFEKVVKKIIDKDKLFQTNVKKFKELPQKVDDERVCGVGLASLCVVVNGDVYPCVGWQKYLCGNLYKTSLQDVWDKSPEIKYLRKLRFSDFKKCVGCQDKDYCDMCMSRNSNEDPNGDIFNIPSITCEAAHIRHKVIGEYRKQNKEN